MSARTFVRMTGSLKLFRNLCRSVVNRMCRFSMCDRAEIASHTVPVCGRAPFCKADAKNVDDGNSTFSGVFQERLFIAVRNLPIVIQICRAIYPMRQNSRERQIDRGHRAGCVGQYAYINVCQYELFNIYVHTPLSNYPRAPPESAESP